MSGDDVQICSPAAYCQHCGDRLIHRDNRQRVESSSGLGAVQVWWPYVYSVMDVDLLVRMALADGSTLLKVLEHKLPGGALRRPQQAILADLARLVEHARTCPASPVRLHAESGVFTIYGRI